MLIKTNKNSTRGNMELPVYMVIVGKGQLYSNALLNLEGNIYSQSKSPTFNAFVFHFSFKLY